MKDQRIGNDLRVKWALVMKGTSDPFLLQGKDVSLYLKGRYGKKKIEDFTVSGNTLEWTFFGKDQKHTGVYSLILVVNEGEEGMVTTDACNFVNLVSCSCKTGGSDECGIFTETVELTSTIEYMAVDTELSETSMNPLANATVTAELEKKVNAVEGMGLSSNDFTDGDKKKLDGFLVIAPTNNAEALKAAFEKYSLAERLHTPIPCFYKENSFDKAYKNAILIVESYPDGYKLNFVNISATSQFKAYDENGNEIGNAFDPEWQWSPKCKLINVECDSYLIQPSGYVMHLGKGEMVIADDKKDESSDRPISNKAFCEALKVATKIIVFPDNNYLPIEGEREKIYVLFNESLRAFLPYIYENNSFNRLGLRSVYYVEYGADISYHALYEAYTEGALCVCKHEGIFYYLERIGMNSSAMFTSPMSMKVLLVQSYPFLWKENTDYKGKVLYNINQSLTEQEKRQARKNIGADYAEVLMLPEIENSLPEEGLEGKIYYLYDRDFEHLSPYVWWLDKWIPMTHSACMVYYGDIYNTYRKVYDAFFNKYQPCICMDYRDSNSPYVYYLSQVRVSSITQYPEFVFSSPNSQKNLILDDGSSWREEVASTEPESEVFEAVYGETTYDEIRVAHNNNKIVICENGGKTYFLTQLKESGDTSAYFYAPIDTYIYRISCRIGNIWSATNISLESTLNKVDTIEKYSSEYQYPSAKAVYDFVQNSITNVLNEEV